METDRKALFFNSFGILASLFIFVSGPLFTTIVVYIMVQVFGLLLIIWALITKKVSKQHKKHTLPDGYFFLDKGPYEIIRHPVYAGYLLVMTSLVEMEFTFLRLVALVILITVIALKIIREEYTMNKEVSEYHEYKTKTKALIPYLL